jgi:REP element-mobilizing transposase RayT
LLGHAGEVPRQQREWIPGEIYHVISQGSDRRMIYPYDKDRLVFLELLARVVRRYELALIAYCLMGNHYHVLAQPTDATLSFALQDLNGAYSKSCNRSTGSVAHLFRNRPKAIHVDSPEYLYRLAAYVPNNPVRAGLCGRAEDWPWSSYAATVGLASPSSWLTLQPLIELFGGEPGWRDRYRSYVADNAHRDGSWVGEVTLSARRRPLTGTGV